MRERRVGRGPFSAARSARARVPLIGALVATLVIGALVPSSPAVGATGSAARSATDVIPTICQASDDSILRDSATTNEGYAEAAEWIAGDIGQREVKRLNTLLKGFGELVVGAGRDHLTQAIIVVVDAAAEPDEVKRLDAALDQNAVRAHGLASD
jgi:hypothetical protein